MPDTNLTDAPRGAVVSPSSVSDLPNVAPCSTLSRRAPLKWIRLGARDIRQALFPSLSYGLLLTLCGYFVVYVAFTFGNVFSVMALASGFILLGPMVAMTFYEISRQLQEGAKPGLLHSLRCSLAHVGEQMVFALILLVIFLIWARAVSMIHVFLPINSQASHAEFALFLGIGTGVGSLFAVLVFCISAFSLPMIVAKKTDSITAVVTSINAVLRNKGAMGLWALLIVIAVGFGLLTGFLGFVVTLPLIGHATWHAYQETINASAWPEHTCAF